MFNRSSESNNTARILTAQENEFIESLQSFLNAYKRRSYFTMFTGDAVIKDSNGNEVDRTALKVKVAQDLINAIKNDGANNMRITLVQITESHGMNVVDFLDGKTKEFLNNDALFELLNTPIISAATLTEHTGISRY